MLAQWRLTDEPGDAFAQPRELPGRKPASERPLLL